MALSNSLEVRKANLQAKIQYRYDEGMYAFGQYDREMKAVEMCHTLYLITWAEELLS